MASGSEPMVRAASDGATHKHNAATIAAVTSGERRQAFIAAGRKPNWTNHKERWRPRYTPRFETAN